MGFVFSNNQMQLSTSQIERNSITIIYSISWKFVRIYVCVCVCVCVWARACIYDGVLDLASVYCLLWLLTKIWSRLIKIYKWEMHWDNPLTNYNLRHAFFLLLDETLSLLLFSWFSADFDEKGWNLILFRDCSFVLV